MSDVNPSPDPADEPRLAAPVSLGRMARRGIIGFGMLALCIWGAAWATFNGIDGRIADAPRQPAALAGVKSWGYQLQNLKVDAAAKSPFDLLVIDRSSLDYGPRDWSGRILQRLQRKPGGGRRLVLSYLSIGEAEDYRIYWRNKWVKPADQPGSAAPAANTPGLPLGKTAQPSRLVSSAAHAAGLPPPASRLGDFANRGLRHASLDMPQPLRVPALAAPKWLGPENESWRGNYHVRFWQRDWQRLTFGSPQAALDQIIAAGYDGVYLDRADIFAHWIGEAPDAGKRMVDFILKLSAYARQKKPGFIVILQNAEELLTDARLRNAIDALAKEDLLYGIGETAAARDGERNPPGDVKASLRYLNLIKRSGRPVLVVEYLDDPEARKAAEKTLTGLGFIAYFGSRQLDDLRVAN